MGSNDFPSANRKKSEESNCLSTKLLRILAVILRKEPFGSVVLLLPDPVSPEQQFEEDLIITTKLGYDPTSGRGIGRRAVRETIRKPIKEIYPASVGSYTSRSENPRGSRRFIKISEGETVTLVDEAHNFEHWDDRLPSDQRETIRIQLIISTLELE